MKRLVQGPLFQYSPFLALGLALATLLLSLNYWAATSHTQAPNTQQY